MSRPPGITIPKQLLQESLVLAIRDSNQIYILNIPRCLSTIVIYNQVDEIDILKDERENRKKNRKERRGRN
jgi:hypothetical protein